MQKTETLKAWAAGMMDGEGTIWIGKTAYSYQITVAVAGSDEDIFYVFRSVWGGRVIHQTPEQSAKHGIRMTRPTYQIVFSVPEEALVLLKDIKPYMIGKVEEAAIVISAMEYLGPRPVCKTGKLRYPPRTMLAIEPFYLQYKAAMENKGLVRKPVPQSRKDIQSIVNRIRQT